MEWNGELSTGGSKMYRKDFTDKADQLSVEIILHKDDTEGFSIQKGLCYQHEKKKNQKIKAELLCDNIMTEFSLCLI